MSDIVDTDVDTEQAKKQLLAAAKELTEALFPKDTPRQESPEQRQQRTKEAFAAYDKATAKIIEDAYGSSLDAAEQPRDWPAWLWRP